MPKVFATKISDAIAADLERRILEGSLVAGARLPSERDLAVDLGVSRPSLREAIQKLASRGLLVSRQGGGTYVADRLSAAFAEPWRALFADHPDLRDDILEFRRVLEGQVAEWAAERRTEADLARLAASFAALGAAFAGTNVEAQLVADLAFHRTLADAAHNVLQAHALFSLLNLMQDDIRVNLAELAAAPRAFSLLQAQHKTLFEAVRDGNPVAARAAATTHLDFVRESLAQSLRAQARRETADRRLSAVPFFSSPPESRKDLP